ncbi:hypothetical protein AUO94_04075 [Planococcus kocurii]|uniref:Polysaccharide biosynthesis protein n=1 Tax=Planococcus kocurii TaxID=1374 RepID=A0ABM5WU56_9BACL|nr:oligosaccharide flippase family protein [Planococcus kocurii]ALS77874.1 hypothetical protein AUO94_04075 [Planococcus kocurii]
MKKLLIKNFSWSFLGSLIYALTQWFLIIIIAKLGSPTDAGVYSLGLAISAPIIMFINLNLRAIQSTDLSIELGFSTFKFTRILGLILFVLTFLTIIIVANYSFEITIILLLIALNKIIESYSDLYYGLFQYHERLDLVSKSYIYRGIIGTIFFGISYYLFKELKIALVFMFTIWLLVLIIYDVKNGKKFLINTPKIVEKNKMLVLVKLGLPLGLVGLIASLNVNIPRITIERYLTLEDLGYFSVIFYLVLIIGKFMTSVSSAVLPRMANLYQNGNKIAFMKILNIVFCLLTLFSVVLILSSYYFGSEILEIAYGAEYSSFKMLLVYIMIYGLFEYLGFVFEVALNAIKYYKHRLSIEILAMIFMILSSIILIPEAGLKGAAIALIISAVLKFLLLGFLFTKIYSNEQRGV